MRLENPYYLFLIVPAFLIMLLYWKGRVGKEASLRFSSVGLIQLARAAKAPMRRLIVSLIRFLILVVIALTLARPQSGFGEREETKNVVDVVIALDTSSSMATLDFHPDNRLAAAKMEAERFIKSRPLDRVGLVVFAKSGITQCPLTTDQAALLHLLRKIELGVLEDGTAIGVGLATAVNRLRETEAKSKVVVLLTDGVNNSGEIDPLMAAKIAQEYGIRVYTIGMGIDGEALLPINDPRYGRRIVRVTTEIDEKTLREISNMTQGLYFRARDEKALRQIFSEIDQLEKTEIRVRNYTRYEDHYEIFLWAILMLMMIELFITKLFVNKLP